MTSLEVPKDLGVPLELPDLPAAWRLALRVCPYCGGGGTGCLHCRGTGDLLGTILLDAYQRGRAHTLQRLREVDEARRFAVRRVLEEQPDVRELKRAMGL